MRRRRKGGAERNALGRSRGGFSTKINARTNAEGLPIGIVITPGQAHDVTAVPALMHEIDCDPEQMLGDKGYDSETVRQDIEQRGGRAMIPSIASRKIQHPVDKALYALRNRIERFFNRVKNSRRVATRYDKLTESFAAFVLLASIRIWIKFVHATLVSRFRRSYHLAAPAFTNVGNKGTLASHDPSVALHLTFL